MLPVHCALHDRSVHKIIRVAHACNEFGTLVLSRSLWKRCETGPANIQIIGNSSPRFGPRRNGITPTGPKCEAGEVRKKIEHSKFSDGSTTHSRPRQIVIMEFKFTQKWVERWAHEKWALAAAESCLPIYYRNSKIYKRGLRQLFQRGQVNVECSKLSRA